MEATLIKNQPFCLIKNLQVNFNDRPILNNINLNLNGTGIHVFVGPSGSGKTTLLRSLNRLNECYSSYTGRGEIKLQLGTELEDIYQSQIDPSLLRRQVGMVFQTPNILPTSIAKNLLLPLKLTASLNKNEREERMINTLKEVHLWDEIKDRLKDKAAQLSGGQQQRLCIARTLALKPSILLLDEPTASLDFKNAQHIEELLVELQHDYRIIAVSHSLRQARNVAQQIVVMKDGHIDRVLSRSQFEDQAILQQLLEQIF
jgi:phosphate transport system ATP-binding protein